MLCGGGNGAAAKDFDFETRVIGGSRSPLGSSESRRSKAPMLPTIEHGDDVNNLTCHQIVDRKGKTLRELTMDPTALLVDAGSGPKAF